MNFLSLFLSVNQRKYTLLVFSLNKKSVCVCLDELLDEMPFNKRTVEPVCLSRVRIPNDIPNELECVANYTLANVIRQLSSLSAHAQDVFDELINDVGHIFQRTEGLHGRIERLQQKVTQLDSNVEEG